MATTERKLGVVPLSALVVGAIVGSGIFSLPQNMAEGAGAGAILIAWGITLVGMLTLTRVFQWLTVNRSDIDDGVYGYAREGFGDYMGFNAAWGYWISAWLGDVGYLVVMFSAQGPFVALNTAAIPSELLESELFGHEAGAFTGAQRRHIGRFEQADGGTLFLDEIGDMPLPLQTRLLRVLAQGEFFRVGGRELIRVDVRVVAATHQDLEGLVAQGKFRADLLHRLDVVRLQLPPLRERREDIAQLASTFLAAAARKLDTPPKRLTAAALQALREHDWPGNVRELENVCWRMAALAAADTIGVADVDTALNRTRGRRSSTTSADPGQWEALLAEWARRQLAEGVEGLHAQVRERVDHALLEAALQITHGRRAEAAARLGLGRNTLTRKLGAGRRRGGH